MPATPKANKSPFGCCLIKEREREREKLGPLQGANAITKLKP